METIRISKKQLDRLKKYNVPEEETNEEGQLYYLKTGIKKIDRSNLLFKRLIIDDDAITRSDSNSISNKINNLNILGTYENIMNLEELVIPKHQVEYKGNIIGFTVLEIKDSNSLQAILSDENINSKDKIDYLKQVGETLKKIHNLRLYDINFYIHDLQEGNILVTNKDNKIHFIDLDSSTFRTDIPLPSKSLITDRKLGKYSKYKYNVFGIPYPGVDQDLYSYNIMILKTLFNGKIEDLTKEEYNDYLNYLLSLGVDKKLIQSFKRIYSNKANINPVDLLDTLTTKQLSQTPSFVYRHKKK